MKLFSIPNILTLMNVLAGCLSVVFASAGQLSVAFVCILLAAVFDFFDGFAARWLHAYSEIGKQLDSLADMISFGLAPAFMLFMSIKVNWQIDFQDLHSAGCLALAGLFSPFVLTAFSALRLAKFNVDERQSTSFIGLPTPANALFFGSLAVLSVQQQWCFSHNAWCTLALVALFSYLLISEIPMFSLKISSFSVKKYGVQYAFLLASLVLLVAKQLEGIPFIILIYIVLSLFVVTYKKLKS